MHELKFTLDVMAPLQAVWDYHMSAEALVSLTPPSYRLKPLTEDLSVRLGAEIPMQVRRFGVPMVWIAKIVAVEPPTFFEDIALKSPFASWTHSHLFEALPNGTRIHDTVRYSLPLGPLGSVANELFVKRDLQSLWAHRHKVMGEALGGMTGAMAP